MSRHLLPPNATAEERALSLAAAARGIEAESVRLTWRPDDCRAELLPWLAWAFHVDDWDDGWSEAAKRAAIGKALELHRHKGTRWAILRQLSALGYENVEILEKRDVDAILRRLGRLVLDGTWRVGEEPPRKIMRPPDLVGIPYLDHWAKFAVVADITEFTRPTAVSEIKRAVNAMKPVRSQPVWGYRMIIEMREKITAWYRFFLEKSLEMPYPWGNLKVDGSWKVGADGTPFRLDGRKIDGTWKIGGRYGRILGPKITNRILEITTGVVKKAEAGICCLTLDGRDQWPMKINGGWKVGRGGPCMQGKISALLTLPLGAAPKLQASHIWEAELLYPKSPAKIASYQLYGQGLDGSWKIGASPTGLHIGGFQVVAPGLSAGVEKNLTVSGRAYGAVKNRIGGQIVKIGDHHSLKLDGGWKIGEQGRKIASHCAKIDGTWRVGGSPLKIGGGWKIGEAGPAADIYISVCKNQK